MNKRIKLELTEDQVSRMVAALENDLFMNGEYHGELSKYEIDSDAFTIRLKNEIKRQREQQVKVT